MVRVYPSQRWPTTSTWPASPPTASTLPQDDAALLLAPVIVVKSKPKAPAEPAEKPEE